MRRDQLEHLVRAAGAILDENELIVIGSQAILGSYGGELPQEATRSIEADILPADDPRGEKADLIDGSIGEGSMFQEAFGIYAQGVSVSTARLPEGWRDRLVPLTSSNTAGVSALCLEVHDLVASKLIAGRPQDVEYSRALSRSGIIDPQLVAERIATCDATDSAIERAIQLLAN